MQSDDLVTGLEAAVRLAIAQYLMAYGPDMKPSEAAEIVGSRLAAAAIERLVAAPETLREVLRQILRCEYDGHGLNDCIDNDGAPYQSAFLANCIAEAENLVSESARQALKDAP